jgi:hypothetical protein
LFSGSDADQTNSRMVCAGWQGTMGARWPAFGLIRDAGTATILAPRPEKLSSGTKKARILTFS